MPVGYMKKIVQGTKQDQNDTKIKIKNFISVQKNNKNNDNEKNNN
jgi:hypothetical protein